MEPKHKNEQLTMVSEIAVVHIMMRVRLRSHISRRQSHFQGCARDASAKLCKGPGRSSQRHSASTIGHPAFTKHEYWSRSCHSLIGKLSDPHRCFINRPPSLQGLGNHLHMNFLQLSELVSCASSLETHIPSSC